MNNFTSVKFLNHRLSSLTAFVKHSTINQSNDFGKEMKLYNDNKQFEKALELFNKYSNNNTETFSNLTITQALKACTHLGNLQRGEAIHRLISSSIKDDTYISASLIHLYMQCGDLTSAESLFDTSKIKTLSMYGAMMKGYIKNNKATKAINLYKKIKNPDRVLMILLFNACAQLGTSKALDLAKQISKEVPKSFYSDIRISISLLDGLIKCGDCSYAEMIFSSMKKSVKGYGNLMAGYNRENNASKTLELFDQMKQNGIEANNVIYLCVIKALSQIGHYDVCQSIIKTIPHCFLVDYQIKCALIDMWGKTGCVDQAKQIFDTILQPEHFAYTTMINCYGSNGMGVQAIELYGQMPRKFIEEVTHVCVLNACSHSGLVDEARSIFRNIELKRENTYTTMIDCLSRAYLFHEAQELIDEYERCNSPAITMHMALLSSARNDKNTDLSQNIYDRMIKLFPQMKNSLTSATVLLANVYASSGDIDKASAIRIQLNKSGQKRKVSLTWTVTNGKIYQFRAHDRTHPRSDEIYAEIEKISKELILHGHQYDSSWVIRGLDQDETIESVLCGHSERLAIAWNFVVNPNASRIQLTKNLRICGDCHRATKLIAAIRQCEIIVRDANRIHRFYTNGQCSCNDYF